MSLCDLANKSGSAIRQLSKEAPVVRDHDKGPGELLKNIFEQLDIGELEAMSDAP